MSRFPWWISVVLAIGSYYGCKYGLVRIVGAEAPLAGLFELFAPIIAMGFLLLAAKQLYDDAPKNVENEDNDVDLEEDK